MTTRYDNFIDQVQKFRTQDCFSNFRLTKISPVTSEMREWKSDFIQCRRTAAPSVRHAKNCMVISVHLTQAQIDMIVSSIL